MGPKGILILKIKHILNEYDADEGIDRFEEIMSEILDLTHDAMQIVREHGDRSTYARADSYWRGHIEQAVEKRDWFSMAATLAELRGEGDE